MTRLLQLLGAVVYTLGTTRRRGDHPSTMMSPGLPDLMAFLPARQSDPPRLLMIECKRAGGQLSPAQAAYRQHCLDAGVAHVVGPLDSLVAWLVGAGYLAVVHHVNGNPKDNKPRNLVIYQNQAYHLYLHTLTREGGWERPPWER